MADLDAREQLFLELTNRARMDPLGEAARYGISLNAGLATGTISTAPKQVLAPNSILEASAQGHANYMMGNNVFSHTGDGGTNSKARMVNAGYGVSTSFSSAENIAYSGSTGAYNFNAQVFELHKGWMLSASHRTAMLNPLYQELGVGHAVTNGSSYIGMPNAMVAVQNFAARTTPNVFVTGVHYQDTDNNDFYSIGEGQGARRVDVIQNGTVVSTATAAAAGGYSARTTTTGAAEVVFSAGGLAATQGVSVVLGTSNIKVDLVDNTTIETNTNATLTQSSQNLRLLGIENINGTGNALNNTIWGNKGNNSLTGGGGNDTLNGGDGNDILSGGTGNDTINGGAGSDTVQLAGNMASYVVTYASAIQTYTFYSVDGSIETVTGVESFAFADGTRTAAQLVISAAPPNPIANIAMTTTSANEGNSGTTAFTFVVTLNRAATTAQSVSYSVAGTGAAAANASDFASLMTGTISFAAGETVKTVTIFVAGDTVFEQNETFSISLTAPSSGLTLGTTSVSATITNDDASAINGTIGNDVISGTAGDDVINGLEGNDSLNGGLGNDSLFGGLGDDSLTGGAGNNALYGGDGTDTFIGGAGIDRFYGEGGVLDIAYYSSSATAVTVNLATNVNAGGDAQGDQFFGVERVSGSAFNDSLTGDGAANYLYGQAGNDTLNGGAGNDFLYGGVGDDTLTGGLDSNFLFGGDGTDTFMGGAGADRFYGDAGTLDIVYYSTSAAGVTVNMATNANAGGDAQGDLFYGVERVYGSALNDSITGDAVANYLYGQSGSDMLNGGLGNDILYGGAANDTFRFTDATFGTDVIADYQDGVDKLSFALSLADSFSDLTISGNGSSSVSVMIGGQTVVVRGAAAITLDAGDFLFT